MTLGNLALRCIIRNGVALYVMEVPKTRHYDPARVDALRGIIAVEFGHSGKIVEGHRQHPSSQDMHWPRGGGVSLQSAAETILTKDRTGVVFSHFQGVESGASQ